MQGRPRGLGSVASASAGGLCAALNCKPMLLGPHCSSRDRVLQWYACPTSCLSRGRCRARRFGGSAPSPHSLRRGLRQGTPPPALGHQCVISAERPWGPFHQPGAPQALGPDHGMPKTSSPNRLPTSRGTQEGRMRAVWHSFDPPDGRRASGFKGAAGCRCGRPRCGGTRHTERTMLEGYGFRNLAAGPGDRLLPVA